MDGLDRAVLSVLFGMARERGNSPPAAIARQPIPTAPLLCTGRFATTISRLPTLHQSRRGRKGREPLRRHADGPRGHQRKRGHDPQASGRRRRSEQRQSGRRNRAHDRGAHRQGRRGHIASRSRRERQREGHRARADRAHVGRARKSCGRGEAASRARRRHQCPHQRHDHKGRVRARPRRRGVRERDHPAARPAHTQRRNDATAVCDSRRQHRNDAAAAGSRRGYRRSRPATIPRPC